MSAAFKSKEELEKLNSSMSLLFLEELTTSDLPNKNIYQTVNIKNVKTEVYETEEFFKEKFNELKTEIYFLNLNIDLFLYLKNKKINIDEYLQQINCFDITVKINKNKNHSYIYTSYYNKLPTFVEGIIIGNKNISSFKSSYSHELTHVLLNKNIHVIDNQFDVEFISTFIEKIVLKNDSNEFKINEFNRLNDIKICKELGFDNITEIIKFQKYYISLLKANYLYFLYRNMNKNQQNILFKNITKIYNGQMLLSDFNNIYNINIFNKELFKASTQAINNSSTYYKNL